MLNLFTGSGVGPIVLYLAVSVFVGLLLGKIKIANVSLGITWVLFVGIALSACGVALNAEMLHIIKEFGLILFVVAVGLQVGPGFFRSFKKGGLAMDFHGATFGADGGTDFLLVLFGPNNYFRTFAADLWCPSRTQ